MKIKKLSGIPSDKEIKENGLNLADMQAKLLQKIEELTLYIIQVNKENKALQEKLNVLESKLNKVLK